MKPTYPLDMGYHTEGGWQPASSTVVDTAPNGHAYVQHLGVYADHEITVEHQYITRDQMEALQRFYVANRDGVMFWVRDCYGRMFEAEFLGPPVETPARAWWHVSVHLLIRRPQ